MEFSLENFRSLCNAPQLPPMCCLRFVMDLSYRQLHVFTLSFWLAIGR